MKLHCRTCGCHFDDDFEETLTEECGLWVERGFSKDMSVEHKRALFDAFFSVPVDEIADDTGVVTDIQLKGYKGLTYNRDLFEQMVPGYVYMSDREKRDFQKRLFKFRYNEDPQDNMLRQLEAMGELKELYQKAFEGANSD